jgi:hypothetical protein
MSSIHEFTDVLFASLLQMDAEAVPTADGVPTGLNWYGKHRHPHQVKPQTEPCWSQRLAELLIEAGVEAYKEIRYPDDPGCKDRRMCDNVVIFADKSVLWMENKGAWKEWWRERGQVGKFRSHLLESGNSAKHDVKKITTLCEPHAHWIGTLLIGFDAAAFPMETDVADFASLAGLDTAPWQPASMHWPDRWREGQRVHAWLWWRKAPDKP